MPSSSRACLMASRIRPRKYWLSSAGGSQATCAGPEVATIRGRWAQRPWSRSIAHKRSTRQLPRTRRSGKSAALVLTAARRASGDTHTPLTSHSVKFNGRHWPMHDRSACFRSPRLWGSSPAVRSRVQPPRRFSIATGVSRLVEKPVPTVEVTFPLTRCERACRTFIVIGGSISPEGKIALADAWCKIEAGPMPVGSGS